MQQITLLDYALLPIFLVVIYAIAYRVRNRNYPLNHPWRKYYLPALTVKIAGSVLLTMLYAYYYGYSDSFAFFQNSKVINSSLNDSLVTWFNLILHIPRNDDPVYYKYIVDMPWYIIDQASYIVAVVGAFCGLITLNTFIPTSVLFACISFSGIWALFRTFASLYPTHTRQIAICVLFIPGVVMWGSGLLKDTLCMFALGWFTFSTFRLLIQKDFRVKNVLLTVVAFIILAKVKIYILVAYVPALSLWIFFAYVQNVKNKGLRIIITFTSILIFGTGIYFGIKSLSDELGAYSIDNIAKTADVTRDWIAYSSVRDDGSGYSLGQIDPSSIGGMLAKFPQAVNVTLFRPYLWEAKKPIVMISALESLLFLFITLKVLFTLGLAKVWSTISQDYTIQFCLIFSMIFSFAVGITTYNFGSLSRYKIPGIPFFAIAIVLIYYKNQPIGKKLLPFM